MKFTVTFKDPDTLHDTIREAAKTEAAAVTDIDDDEREMLAESRAAKLGDLCRQWFKWSEYVSIEIDTEAKTATVLKASAT